MPVRRRVARRRQSREVDWRIFRFSDGTWHFFAHESVYPNVETARAAWGRCRREVWAISRRMWPPAAALAYDGFSRDGFDALWSTWQCATFGADEGRDVLAAIERDRASVAAFQECEPRAARSIADYLDVWLRYLDRLEEVTRDLMDSDADSPRGSVLHRILTKDTFAEAADAGQERAE